LVLSGSSGRFIWRRRCGFFGIATLHGFRVIGTVLIIIIIVIRFRFQRGDHADRHSLFDWGLDFYCGGIGLE